MGYDKGSKNSGGGKFMDNGKGMCSYPNNPMKAAARVSRECGPGMNPEQKKANKLLHEQHKEKEAIRGETGM